MRKALVIAAREYRAAVRTKAFVLSLVLLPVLMSASVLIQVAVKKVSDTKEKRYAVVDRTPGAALAPLLAAAVEERNKHLDDPDADTRSRSPFAVEAVEPGASDPESVARQRYELSQRVQRGELHGFLDIGPDVYAVRPPGTSSDDRSVVRYQSNKPTDSGFYRWADRVVNEGVQRRRFADSGLSREKVQAMQQAAPLRVKGLSKLDPVTGEVVDATDESQVANFLVPAALIGLMFMLIMVGATPLMQGVVEEKMQRIAEVLLGSVRPFELMFGKLIGMTGVSLTVAALYLAAAYGAASYYGYTEYLSPVVVAWFLVFQVLALLLYGSLFIAVGAAATDMKDTQTLMWPVMFVAVMPMFVMIPVIQEPNGKLATVASMIPTATPMLMVGRLGVPPGVPWWHPVLGMVLVLATTLVCVWAAGRIFRVGLLRQGQGTRFGDMIKWAVRG
jgi:ABC-2 type transport system permease protein